MPQDRNAEPDPAACPDAAAPDKAQPDRPDPARLKRHGDDLQASVDKAARDRTEPR